MSRRGIVRQRTLMAIMALGAVVTLIGSAGIFAVFTDRATTGTNTVTSGEQPSAAHLRIATASPGTPPGVCGTFVDDLTTGLFALSDVQPGAGYLDSKHICLMNAGASSLTVTATVIDLVDVETECTGDEATVDASCGSGVGELSSVVTLDANQDCGTSPSGVGTTLSELAGTSGPIDPLAPGEVLCIGIFVSFPDSSPALDVQAAQTDQVSWRLAFDGTAA